MNPEKHLISIICAIRNDARFIRETLESVVAQTYPNWELIIMDGASTDATPQIAKEYADKYRNIILRSEPDEGQWHALDKALALAKGEFIMTVCGQDGYLNKNWLAECAQAFERNPEVSLVWGVPFDMSEDGKLLGPHYAYASFLNDPQYAARPKPLRTIMAKIDWQRSSAWERLKRLLGKITWSRIKMVLKSFRPHKMPQKEHWFFYWLKTGRAFPEGNMCVRRNVYERLTRRFPEETMTNAAMLDFCFKFNAGGYLSYGLPLAASFGRLHAGGQALRDYDDMLTAKYNRQISEFRTKISGQKTLKFIDAAGNVVSERAMSV